MRITVQIVISLLFGALLITTAPAGVEPSPFINFQGVLRDAGNNPLDGAHDMIFRFWDAESLGSEIIIDEHLGAGTGDVLVEQGFFSAVIGQGDVSDGSGPGLYGDLSELFRDFSEVWLQIEVYHTTSGTWETLSPRARVLSSGYAMNASHLDGKNSDEYLDTSPTAQTKSGPLVLNSSEAGAYALEGHGAEGGGSFSHTGGGTGYAYVGNFAYGISGYGHGGGGYFQDTAGDATAYVGSNGRGIYGWGTGSGGYFENDESGIAWCARSDYGIYAVGDEAGGYYESSAGTGYAYTARGDTGVEGYGTTMGGYFEDTNNTGFAYAAWANTGLMGYGTTAGGSFNDIDGSGTAFVAFGDLGISASGNTAGGLFKDSLSSGWAYAGYGDYGIHARGNTMGGYFKDYNSSGYSYVGYGDRGIWARGTFAGGTFSHPDSVTFWADVSTSTRKIIGTGTVSFVQNHPYDLNRVIVYAAPEGDEVATYTRGSARLIGGVARVTLGETFKWVTNPDIGLTAHLTPRDAAVPLAVVSLTTEEMVVRGPADGPQEVEFDYIVHGLRLGFEEAAIIQEKDKEAFLPSPEAIGAAYGGDGSLKSFNALERFKRMDAGGVEVEMSGARTLVAALEEQRAVAMKELEVEEPPSSTTVERTVDPSVPGLTTIAESEEPAAFSDYPVLPISAPVQPGDVLVFDPERPGYLKPAGSISDPAVAGIAAENGTGGKVPVAVYGVVECRVDAGYGAIHPGDLLATSPTPGYAMRAMEIVPGTILGKAAEPLENGTGTIRVLVMSR